MNEEDLWLWVDCDICGHFTSLGTALASKAMLDLPDWYEGFCKHCTEMARANQIAAAQGGQG